MTKPRFLVERREAMAEALDEADPKTQWEMEFIEEMQRLMGNDLWVPTEDQVAKAEEIAQR
jgi:hypothetical protein